MKRRCCMCKHLEEESARKYYERCNDDPLAKFFCKTCKKNDMKLIPKVRASRKKEKTIIDPEIAKNEEIERRISFGREIRHRLKYGIPTHAFKGT